jgi:hypothetical protein
MRVAVRPPLCLSECSFTGGAKRRVRFRCRYAAVVAAANESKIGGTSMRAAAGLHVCRVKALSDQMSRALDQLSVFIPPPMLVDHRQTRRHLSKRYGNARARADHPVSALSTLTMSVGLHNGHPQKYWAGAPYWAHPPQKKINIGHFGLPPVWCGPV